MAESTLGMFIYDFHFELENPEESQNDALKIGVSDEATLGQPIPKKPRTEEKLTAQPKETSREELKSTSGKGGSFKNYQMGQSSAPAKLAGESFKVNRMKANENESAEETGYGSDESNDYSLGFNGSGLKENSSQSYNGTRLMQCSKMDAEITKALFERKESAILLDKQFCTMSGVSDKGDIEITDLQTQANVSQCDGKSSVAEMVVEAEEGPKQNCNKVMKEQVETCVKDTEARDLKHLSKIPRRASSRLKKDLLLTTDDKTADGQEKKPRR